MNWTVRLSKDAAKQFSNIPPTQQELILARLAERKGTLSAAMSNHLRALNGVGGSAGVWADGESFSPLFITIASSKSLPFSCGLRRLTGKATQLI